MENVNVLEQVIRLVAKTGLYFAKVDGDYSEREKAFIQVYMEQLEQAGGTKEEVEAIIGDIEHRNITLEEVVGDTRQVLETMTPREAGIVKLTLCSFIDDIVKADGEDCKAEQEAFEAWKAALY
ncbi:MAG: hypothetical protein J5565_05600 [Muribaculaceae bacterium]|nr:hypothetical protein [Muribaculaceae bacterium]